MSYKIVEEVKQTGYEQHIKEFEYLCEVAIKLSMMTSRKNSPKEKYAATIFTKVCVTSVALYKTLPAKTKSAEFWDVYLVSILARSILEAYYVLNCLARKDIGKDEVEFRFNLWRMYGEARRLEMLERLNEMTAKPDGHTAHPEPAEPDNNESDESNGADETTESLEEPPEFDKNGVIDELKKKLEENKYYKKLTSDQQKLLVNKGTIALQEEEIAKSTGISSVYYDWIYKYLPIYSYPLSLTFKELSALSIEDTEAFELLGEIAVFCDVFLSFSIRDFLKIFKAKERNAPPEIWQIINNWESEVRAKSS